MLCVALKGICILNQQYCNALLSMQVDRLRREQQGDLQRLAERMRGVLAFEQTFCISARHGTGVPELRQHLLFRCIDQIMPFITYYSISGVSSHCNSAMEMP